MDPRIARSDSPRMAVLKRYCLRMFFSLKYATANVVDRTDGRIVASASSVEHSMKRNFECGRTCNAKAAAIVGEVLAMRLRVGGLQDGQGRGIHVNVTKEVEKKGFKDRTKVWAVVNSLRDNGVKLIFDDDHKRNVSVNGGGGGGDVSSRPSWYILLHLWHAIQFYPVFFLAIGFIN